MNHGVTHSNAYKTARRASIINKKTNVTVQLTKEMIKAYENELLSHKKRLAVLEQAEFK